MSFHFSLQLPADRVVGGQENTIRQCRGRPALDALREQITMRLQAGKVISLDRYYEGLDLLL